MGSSSAPGNKAPSGVKLKPYFKRCFFSKTGSTGGTITALSFEGCSAEDDDECEAAKGTTVVGQMTFAASAATESLECSIYGIIFGVEIPFPGGCPVVDACSALSQGDCPVEAGEEIVYDLSIKIENIFPAVSSAIIHGSLALDARAKRHFSKFDMGRNVQIW